MSVVANNSPGARADARGTALIVDDQLANRLLLRDMLIREGFGVLEATSGEEALALFAGKAPDIVFMDIMMPGLDGYETTRQLKRLSDDRFVPVIFLTALADEEALVRCVAAGGDDFLTRPFSRAILSARIAAMERISELYRDLTAQHAELVRLHNEMLRQHEVAERIFARAISDRNQIVDRLQTLLKPASTFTGDVLLTAERPTGAIDVLIGDFTGHDLSAAIGTLPLSEVFYAMTEKGLPPADIINQINEKIYSLLPTGMFLAATYLSIRNDLSCIEVWNGGMPDVLVICGSSGKLKERIPSTHIPLGIAHAGMDEVQPVEVSVQQGDQVLLYSDGLLEAENGVGAAFGDARLLEAIERECCASGAFGRVESALHAFCGEQEQRDDITLVGVPVTPGLLRHGDGRHSPHTSAEVVRGDEGAWRWFIDLRGQNLALVDPVALALHQLQEIGGIQEHLQPIQLVLSELYNNALEHGILGLDSTMKDSAEGFSAYYDAREARLAEVVEGWIWMEVEHCPRSDGGGRVTVRVHDSGPGFDYHRMLHGLHRNRDLHGRGIALVSRICSVLRYEGVGNLAKAVYEW
jgi:CheY-like chemotaxis protein/anti-sigma regulatory factor (Ser/Thr protein kinase)